MRSVFLHITEPKQKDAEAFLSSQFPGQSHPWIYPSPPADNVLFIDIEEFDENERPTVVETLGKKPDFTIVADVSGRHPGDVEILHFVNICLSKFSGFAQDDYTEHLWTLQEIRDRQIYQEHRFFDYLGWYEYEKVHRGMKV